MLPQFLIQWYAGQPLRSLPFLILFFKTVSLLTFLHTERLFGNDLNVFVSHAKRFNWLEISFLSSQSCSFS